MRTKLVQKVGTRRSEESERAEPDLIANPDRVEIQLAAAGYNFRRLLAWLRFLLLRLLIALGLAAQLKSA